MMRVPDLINGMRQVSSSNFPCEFCFFFKKKKLAKYYCTFVQQIVKNKENNMRHGLNVLMMQIIRNRFIHRCIFSID